jgi:hypothetical protein
MLKYLRVNRIAVVGMKLEEVIDIKELEKREKMEERKEERREERKKTSADAIAKLFGDQFARKYQEALQKAQEIPKEKLRQMKPLLIELLKSSSDFRASFDKFDVILVTTPTNVERFPPKKTSAGNWKVTVVWPGSQSLRGPFVSVFVSEESDAKLLSSTPDKAFILIGKLQTQSYMGDTTYSFRTAGIIEVE